MPPTLVVGGTGSGKSEMAEHLAANLGYVFKKKIIGPTTSREDLKALLQTLDHFDVVLLDEAHNLSKDCQEFFYTVFDRWEYTNEPSRSKKDKVEVPLVVSVSKANFVFATDQPGKLLHAFLRRLHKLHMTEYKPDEVKGIILAKAEVRTIPITSQAARVLASVAKGSPGEAIRLLEALWSWVEDDQQIGESDVRAFFDDVGIDEQTGLSEIDHKYLRALASMPTGRAPLKHLDALLMLGEAEISRHIEPYLIRKGLIETDAGGRRLTELGRNIIKEMQNDSEGGDGVAPAAQSSVPSEPTGNAGRDAGGGEVGDLENDGL